MKQLETKYRKNDHDFVLVERTENAAIYEQWSDGKFMAYEVFEVLKVKEKEIQGRIIAAHEAVPSNEDLGQKGWTVHQFSRAMQKMAEIQERCDSRKTSQTQPQ